MQSIKVLLMALVCATAQASEPPSKCLTMESVATQQMRARQAGVSEDVMTASTQSALLHRIVKHAHEYPIVMDEDEMLALVAEFGKIYLDDCVDSAQ